jgi:hypothetical protein
MIGSKESKLDSSGPHQTSPVAHQTMSSGAKTWSFGGLVHRAESVVHRTTRTAEHATLTNFIIKFTGSSKEASHVAHRIVFNGYFGAQQLLQREEETWRSGG